MLILAPTYSMKIFIGQTVMTTYVIPFVIGMLLARDSHVGTLVRVGPKQTVFTPFRDGIWNRRQVSVGDRGGPSHTT